MPLYPPEISDRPVSLIDVDQAERTFRDDLLCRRPSTLPFPTYARAAFTAAYEELEDVRQQHGWLSKLFSITRAVKAHPTMADVNPKAAFIALNEALDDDWLDDLDLSFGDAENEFFNVWEKARTTPGLPPIDCATEWARRHPLTLPPGYNTDARPSTYIDFVSLVGWLQVVRGNKPLIGSGKIIGKAMDLSAMSISTCIRYAIEDGFLKRVKPYQTSRKKGQIDAAAEYFFDVGQFPELQARAEKGTLESFHAANHVENPTHNRQPKPPARTETTAHVNEAEDELKY